MAFDPTVSLRALGGDLDRPASSCAASVAAGAIPGVAVDQDSFGVGIAIADDPRALGGDGGPGGEPAKRRSFWRRWAMSVAGFVETLFGCVSLCVLLAIVATLPVLQLMSLGYLLEVSSRVSHSGRVRDGLFGAQKAARVGAILLGLWLLTFPLRLAATLWGAAQLIDASSPAARVGMIVFYAATALVALHAVGALLRGGRLRDFLIPRPLLTVRLLASRDLLIRARDGLWRLATGLRLPYYFVRGAKGFFGGFAWLVAPTALLAIAPQLPSAAGGVVTLVGAALLFWATFRLPLLEAAFAAEDRWQALFEPGRCRRAFARAPLAFALAIALTLLLSTPLFALKIEMIPREAAWLPSLLFVLTGVPARLAMGWAWGRAQRRQTPCGWLGRWSGRLIVVVVAAAYVLVTYLSQFLSWHGVWSLCSQHAFLTPAPFLDFDF